jgi:hypothetical protein
MLGSERVRPTAGRWRKVATACILTAALATTVAGVILIPNSDVVLRYRFRDDPSPLVEPIIARDYPKSTRRVPVAKISAGEAMRYARLASDIALAMAASDDSERRGLSIPTITYLLGSVTSRLDRDRQNALRRALIAALEDPRVPHGHYMLPEDVSALIAKTRAELRNSRDE